ncbi:peptide/nickel transport system ATP-binding protein [Inquilinus ginsengisoli]|uniref:ABC transporter ATP-binding protein n=1 Tax=Inquilinus ginsengisoli TaxID=363840 RepID=UPI003D2233F1
MTPLLAIEDLRVPLPPAAERLDAVSNLSLALGRGEILCVVGESGSGKSMTALAVMGLLPANLPAPSGRVLFEGRDLLALSERERRDLAGRRIAMIFQEPSAALNPIYRVGNQVAETFRLHTKLSSAEIRERVLALFREVRLPDPELLYHSYPHQLSGGQCQRVMIATALALDPAILIADEPTTALDVTTQAQILRLMLDLRQRHGTGILFITHDFGVVAEIADRVAVMQNGRLVEEGPRDRVLRRPEAAYTRDLLAAVPKLEPRRARPGLGPVAVSAKGIAKTFRKSGLFGGGRSVKAVDGVDVEIRRGETLGLVGESGSGKSTLAQCIIRLIEPERGDIVLAAGSFSALKGKTLRAARRRVQIVFQDPYSALDPRQSVGAAIAEGPVIHGLDRDGARDRALKLLQAVGLDAEAAGRFPHEFSGGQRQRICIARALAIEPDLLIADESVSALDVSVQAQILDLLAEMQQRLGFAMLFITHDLRVASRICDRIAVMRQGRIVEGGEPATLFGAPREAYTRELLSAVPGRDWGRDAAGPEGTRLHEKV